MVATLAELKTAVSDELRRDADDIFQTRLPRLVAQAEQQIERDLRTKEREGFDTITTTAQVATVAAPDDLYAVIGLVRPGYPPLRQVTPAAFDGAWNTNGLPLEFSHWAGDLWFGPTPDAVYTYRLRYWKTLPRLATDDGHAAFLAHWDVWFYATMVCASPGLVDDERVQMWVTLYKGAIESANGIGVESLAAQATMRRAYGSSRA